MTLQFLHVIESCNSGGMETTFLNMLRVFARRDPGVQHHVLAFQDGRLRGAFASAAATLTIGSDTAAIDGALARGRDLVHILFERCAYRILPRLLARSAVPIVYGKGYDMGGMYRVNEGLRWQADESMLVAADAVTFTTAGLANAYAVPAGRTTVLRKAADTRAFGEVPPMADTTPPRVVAVANVHPRKRLGDLIEAFAAVRRRHPRAELRLIGGGDPVEWARLEARVESLGLETRVTFTGPVTDVAGELADARVMALPSSCEGVSTAVIEAMAAGRPVVATRTGHIASVVEDGVTGHLVAVGDVPALADRIIRLLDEPERARTMGERGREVAARHAVDAVADDLLATLTRTAAMARRQITVSSLAPLAG